MPGDNSSLDLAKLLLPIHNELERDILGACFQEDTSAITEVRTSLVIEDFGSEKHRRLFRALCALHDRGDPLVWSLAFSEMEAQNPPSILSLSELSDYSSSHAWALSHLLQSQKDFSRRRRLVGIGYNIALRSNDLSFPLEESIERASAELKSVLTVAQAGEDEGTVAEIISSAGGMEKVFERKVGISSPWPDFNEYTGGWSRSDLFVLAARPSMGKTALALNALYAAAKRGVHCVFYSCEMSRESITLRLLSLITAIPYRDLQQNELNANERQALKMALERICDLPLRIIGSSGHTVLSLAAHMERLSRMGRCDFAILDYIGLIKAAGRSENRNREIGDICRVLKNAAVHANIALLLLAQLNRGVEARKDKRPELSDLRDSGEIEEHADEVAFLYRPEYYDGTEPTLHGLTELHIAKQRNGATGTIKLEFVPYCGRFLGVGKSGSIPFA